VRNNAPPVTTSRDRSYEYARARRRRAPRLRTCTCFWCGRVFTSWYDRTRWCSHRCRSDAHRGPKTFALITWRDLPHHAAEAQWTFHPTRAAARAAAPAGEPWSVVDTSRQPWVRWPTIYELTHRTRLIDSDDPYRATSKGDRKWLT
jgi:hypothetical protein